MPACTAGRRTETRSSEMELKRGQCAVGSRGGRVHCLNRIIACLAMAGALAALSWPPPVRVSLQALLRPLAPNEPIPGVAGGYVLAEPVSGHEGDLVLLATSGARHVEIHLLDRGHWKEAIETPSFGVAYEAFGSNAPPADCAEVVNAVVTAIRASDPGNLHIDQLARHAHAPTLLERVLDRLKGERAVVAGLLLVGLGVLLTTTPLGYLAFGLLLAALGFWFRATRLDLPFALDGDVQRVFTAHLPLRDIVDTALFHDRHPPFMFILLHVVQRFGESETVVRLPAVIAGTLVGPAILAAVQWLRQGTAAARRRGAPVVAACAALTATASPVLVERSREVSELTLFGLLAVVTFAASLRACERPTGAALWLVALGHALLFWTYYLAGFLLVGFWLAMRWAGPIDRRLLRAVALGILAGLPGLAFAALTLLRDRPVRQIARVFPQVVWGERATAAMALEISHTVLNAFGAPLVVLMTVLVVVALVRRERVLVAPIAAAGAVAAGMLVLVQPARIQAYYIVCAMPLLPLALALFDAPSTPRLRLLTAAVAAMATAASVPRLLANDADRIYASDLAFGRRFAMVIAARPESRVAVAFAPDATLLAYSLARAAGLEIDWRDLRQQDGTVEVTGVRQQLLPLLPAWSLDEGSGKRAIVALDELAREDDFLAVSSNPAPMAEIGAWLERCAELDHTAVRRLLHCSKQR